MSGSGLQHCKLRISGVDKFASVVVQLVDADGTFLILKQTTETFCVYSFTLFSELSSVMDYDYAFVLYVFENSFYEHRHLRRCFVEENYKKKKEGLSQLRKYNVWILMLLRRECFQFATNKVNAVVWYRSLFIGFKLDSSSL